ncbi:Probable RNA-directed DNA polymerase from transposon BS [Anthophora plagiata]
MYVGYHEQDAGESSQGRISSRIQSAIRAAEDLSPRQYGFRAGRSTVNAVQEVIEAVCKAEDHNYHLRRVVLLVTLDVKNAFNSAKWCDMLMALEQALQVPCYLTCRLILERPQGSVLGPDLWNAFYDDLLRLEMPEEAVLIGYADDVAAFVAVRTVEQAQRNLNRTMLRVNVWMEGHGLSLALNNIEIVVLTKRRINTIFPMRVSDITIETKNSARYLGVSVDIKLNFGEHIS